MTRTKMNYGQIIQALTEAGITVEQFVGNNSWTAKPTYPKELGTMKVVKKASFEDYEEQGRQDEDTHITHFVDHDLYLATIVQADSYGEETAYPYGYGKQVFPKEKTVLVYE